MIGLLGCLAGAPTLRHSRDGRLSLWGLRLRARGESMVCIPPPFAVGDLRRSVSSVAITIEQLEDGRMRYAIEHALQRGLTPAMIVWCLSPMESIVELGGERVCRVQLLTASPPHHP